MLLWSSSSLRFAPAVQALQASADEIGAVTGVSVHGPASLAPGNPGLFHYGVHGVQVMYQLMGRGCETVRLISNADGDVAVGQWSDGRFGVFRGLRRGASPYGVTVYGEKGVKTSAIGTTDIYRELLTRIVAAFQERQSAARTGRHAGGGGLSGSGTALIGARQSRGAFGNGKIAQAEVALSRPTDEAATGSRLALDAGTWQASPVYKRFMCCTVGPVPGTHDVVDLK